MKLMILARNAAQATQFALRHGLALQNVCYVLNEFAVKGYRDAEYVVLDGFWGRHDAWDIWRTLMEGQKYKYPPPLGYQGPTANAVYTPAPKSAMPARAKKKPLPLPSPDDEGLAVLPDDDKQPAPFVPTKGGFKSIR